MEITACVQTHPSILPAGRGGPGPREGIFDLLVMQPVAGPCWLPAAVEHPARDAARPIAAQARPESAGLPDETSGAPLLAREVTRVASGLCGLRAEGLEFAFVGGWLQGVRCRVAVDGTRVRCRLKSPGAASREVLRACAGRLARRLAAGGLQLDGFEVQP